MRKWKWQKNTRNQWKNYRNIITKKYAKRVQLIKFLVALILLAAPLYAIMESSFSLYIFESPYAKGVSWILNAQGINTNITKGYEEGGLLMPILEVENYGQPIGFGRACTGYRSILAIFALIFAVPGISIKRKAKGFAVAAPVMIVINFIRLYVTVLAGALFGVEAFSFVHTILWRVGLIGAVLIIWILWLRTQRKPAKNKKGVAA